MREVHLSGLDLNLLPALEALLKQQGQSLDDLARPPVKALR